MIIGNGMLAREFISYRDDKNIVIFASGVSNSNETRVSEFNREKALLLENIHRYADAKLIYFSTCSMYDFYFPNNKYTEHKMRMEQIIASKANNYTIIRLPQIVGQNNKFQLLGFLNQRIRNNESFDLFDIERNLIDISDVKRIVDLIILKQSVSSNMIVNIANKNNILVIQLVEKLEKLLNKKGKYTIVRKKGSFVIDTMAILNLLNDLNIDNDTYIDRMLRKYYE